MRTDPPSLPDQVGTWDRPTETPSRTVAAADILQDSQRLRKFLGRGRRDRTAQKFAEVGLRVAGPGEGQIEAATLSARGGG